MSVPEMNFIRWKYFKFIGDTNFLLEQENLA
jgi:hypothetical protein